MRLIKLLFLSIVVLSLTNCASGYKMIEPSSINYQSVKENDGLKFEYKYDLLKKKYAKKEEKKGIRIVAVKITNNSGKDMQFGKDFRLSYENGNQINIVNNEYAFKTLKQSTASYLFYLLLAPINLTTTETNNNGTTETNNIFPIGLILGPAIAGGNMIAAGTANKKFEQDLLGYNITDKVVKDGETIVGLISIQSDRYDALKLILD